MPAGRPRSSPTRSRRAAAGCRRPRRSSRRSGRRQRVAETRARRAPARRRATGASREAPAPCGASARAARRARAPARGSFRRVSDPERELHERLRYGADDRLDGPRLDAGRRLVEQSDDDPAGARPAERHAHDRADLDGAVDLVRELARDCTRRDERIDGRERRHAVSGDSLRCSALASTRRRLNDSVPVISAVAISPRMRLVATIVMFIPTLKAISSVREIASPRNR